MGFKHLWFACPGALGLAEAAAAGRPGAPSCVDVRAGTLLRGQPLALHHESRPVEACVHLGLSLGPDAAANAIHLLALDLVGAVLLLHELGRAPVFPWGSHGSYRPLSPDLLATVHVVAVFVAAESLALLRLADGVGRLQLAVEFPLLLLRVLLVGHEVTSHR